MTSVDLLCDLQYGSTGKGLFAGFLGYTGDYTATVSANMPNAGHTFIDGELKWIFKTLPIAAVAPGVSDVFIGPGSVFSLERLIQEWSLVPNNMNKRLIIHEGAVLLQDEHREAEQLMLNHIASTMQGSMAAMAEKMMRNPNADPRAKNNVRIGSSVYVVSDKDYNRNLRQHSRILVEGSQGYSLGINAGFWPFCTSRDCTPARILADCGIPAQWLRLTYGTLRTFPIRVGNTEGGNSGPVHVDQEELTWEEIGVAEEMTTVTGRVRRVFTFSWEQYEQAWRACQPDYLFLNFVNYMPRPAGFVNNIAKAHFQWGGRDAVWIGTGPKLDNVRLWS